MRYAIPLLAVAVLASAAAAPAAGPKAPARKPPERRASFEPVTLPLTVMEGDLFNRDSRVFGVPVECAGVTATFTWGCAGETIVSEVFAKRSGLTVKPDADLAQYLDAGGRPLFLGSAVALITIAGQSLSGNVWVMRDAQTNKEPTGIIGYQVARQFQWEVNPRARQITLRPPGTPLPRKPIASIPLRDENQNLWLNVKVRNVAVDVALIPQSTDFQAGPDLQKNWDLEGAGLKVETKSYLGNVRTVTLTGKSGVHLSGDVFETDVLTILLENNPNARSGIGQSLLNRFVYCVDAEAKRFHVLERVSLSDVRATTQPSKIKRSLLNSLH